MTFKSQLEESIGDKNSSLCLGIDPHLELWPPLFEKIKREEGILKSISYWAHSILEIARADIPAVKFQSAMFESYGSEGFRLLRELTVKAKNLGFHVILDAKRADIASTMAAYGKSAFDVFQADSLTVLPYMGSDILQALAPWLMNGKGIYLVWVSSNESGKEVQLLENRNNETLAEVILDRFADRAHDLGVEGSYGLVLGATMLDQLSEPLWRKAQAYPLLLPGLGAQGGSPDHPKVRNLCKLGSHLFPMSRSLTGVGDKSNAFANAHSLDAYQQVLRTRISQHAKPLVVSPHRPVS